MKNLLPYLKPYRKECVIAPLLKCTEALVDLFVPLLIARLIDEGIGTKSTSVIITIGLELLGLAALGLIIAMIAQWFSAKAAVGFSSKIRSVTFKHIQHLSFQSADTLGQSTLITRLTSDINQTQTGINMTLRLLLRSPFIVFGSVIMAYQVDPGSAWIFLLIVPLLVIVVYGIMWITIPLYRKVQGKLDKVVGISRENLTGVRVLRAFNLQQHETEEFDERNNALTAANVIVGRFSALTNPLTFLLINLATAVLLYVGAIRVNIGNLTQGQVVALLNYMAQILVELVKLANLIVTITKSIASASRVSKIIDTPSDMAYPETSEAPFEDGSVTFDHVTFTYQGAGAPSLTDVSFTARSGETIGVIGGTGSGKFTLVSLIPRFYDATEGSVKVSGHDVRSFTESDLRSHIGPVMQKAVLFAGTIRENMQYSNETATDEEIWEALELSPAAEFVRGKEDGLDEIVEQGGRNLSGGQKQRLGIARALVRKPAILILDDSSSALDFATDAKLRQAIKSLPYPHTTFIVSQRISSIRHADHILVLSETGELVGDAPHDELMKTCEVYREIYKSQYKEEPVNA